MVLKLVLLFVAMPVLELVILIQLGRSLGLLPTLVLVLGTGVAGAALARRQGLGALRRIRQELAAGRMPMAELLDGLFILVGAILLLTPGLLSDITGLSMLFPPTRRAFEHWLSRRLERMIRSGNVTIVTWRP